jgi:hypothetical protein
MDELAVSEVSGQTYRFDQRQRSEVSGTSGHQSEFIQCHETRQVIVPSEAEQCDASKKLVRKGVLQRCSETGSRVLPSELAICSVTGKRALQKLLTTSSVSQQRFLEKLAVRAGSCFWSGRPTHPSDLRTCSITGLTIHSEFATLDGTRLRPLAEMLGGTRRTSDEGPLWNEVASRVSSVLKGKKCRIEAAVLSPASHHLAACCEIRTLLGMKVRQAGAIFDLADHSIVGRVTEGKRDGNFWRAHA